MVVDNGTKIHGTPIDGADVFCEIFVVQLRHVLANDICHGVELAIALSNRLDGVGVVLDFRFLNAA